MKKMALVLFIVGVGLINAQVEVPNAPQWKITLHVINEDGTPVTNATAFVDYYVPAPPPERQGGYKWTGLTDCSGCFTVAIHAGQHIGYGAEKPVYYSTDGLEYRFQSEVDRKWQPWNPTNDIVLKRIIKPIPMYAKRIDAQPPADGNPVGYDLMVGDWVAPYGKGINPDILFTREYNRKSLQDYDYKLTVSFPKAGDGIQEFLVPYKNMEGSALRSPHEAPTNGYQPQIVRLNISHPGQKLIFDYDENRVYFFRVRTVLDENGNVKSALYGKTYGDFMQFAYYVNPTPNSRNVEFDPKQNMMKNLKPLEGVDAP